jgi:hypothetical protein
MSRCIRFVCCLVLVSFLGTNKSYAQAPDQGKSKVSTQSQPTPNQPPRFVDPFEGSYEPGVQRVMIVWYKKTAQETNSLARQLSRQYAKKADIALFEWDISSDGQTRSGVVSDPGDPTASSNNPYSHWLTGLKREGGVVSSDTHQIQGI